MFQEKHLIPDDSLVAVYSLTATRGESTNLYGERPLLLYSTGPEKKIPLRVRKLDGSLPHGNKATGKL